MELSEVQLRCSWISIGKGPRVMSVKVLQGQVRESYCANLAGTEQSKILLDIYNKQPCSYIDSLNLTKKCIKTILTDYYNSIYLSLSCVI